MNSNCGKPCQEKKQDIYYNNILWQDTDHDKSKTIFLNIWLFVGGICEWYIYLEPPRQSWLSGMGILTALIKFTNT